MKAEIIAVGTEILLGQIVNTNAAYLSEFLANAGVEVYYQTAVGDNEARILSILEEADKRSDLIILCGGLGPTDDDLTKQTVAKHVGKQLIYDKVALEHVEHFFINAARPMTENNKKQALTIETSLTIQNTAGLACGCLYENETSRYLLLPGPPRELKAMLRDGVAPLFDNIMPQHYQLVSRYLRFMGIGESRLATELKELLDTQTNPTIAPYAKSNEVMIRLTAKCETKTDGDVLLDALEEKIQAQVGDFFYGYGEHTTIEEVVVNLLKERQQTVTFIEGLTGGSCFERITSIPGSSSVCPGGFVTYTKESKEKLLNIPDAFFNQYGVVSKESAIEMAKKGQEMMGTDYAVSIVGVAGPLEVEGKASGSIVISVVTREDSFSEELFINRERDYVRDGAVKHSLNLLRKKIK